MKTTFKYYVIAWAALLVTYNVIVFAVQPVMGVAKNYDTRFWLAWGFIFAAFIGQLICAFVAFKAENKGKLFLNITLITESYAALVAMTLGGSILMLIPNFPSWLTAIVCVIILAFSVVTVLSAKAAAEIVSNVEEKVKVQTAFIRNLTMEADGLVARAKTPEIKAEVKKVYEAIRYSNPMSREGLEEIEEEISKQFDAFSQSVLGDDVDAVKARASELVALVYERNKKCKV